LCELRFTGRRSGRLVCLPAQCARDGDRVVVYAGRAAGKRWWWNFTDPHPVVVRAGGVTRAGTGRLVAAGHPDRVAAESVYRRRLRRRTVAWRGRLPWLALALLAPLALFAVAAVAARLVDGTWPDVDRFGASTEYPALPLVGYWLASLLFYGYGEEIGWRGFLQPALQQRRSALAAAVAVSVVWAGWHLPLFGITTGYRDLPAAGFVGFYLSLLVAALVLAWLYLRSNGSLLVLVVFHAGYDIATNTPTSTTLIPILMGAAITVAGLATIPALRKARPVTHHRGPVAVSTSPGPVTP
jgi:uncharacterized protein